MSGTHRRPLRFVPSPGESAPARQEPDRLLNMRQVAALLNVGVSTAYRMAERETLPTVRFDGSSVVRVSERRLMALLATGGTRR